MGYVLTGPAGVSVRTIAAAMGGWRVTHAPTLDTLGDAYAYDPSQRMRNVDPATYTGAGPGGSGGGLIAETVQPLFTRHWADVADGVPPMVCAGNQFLNVGTLAFTLALPSVSLAQTVHPIPMAFGIWLQYGPITLVHGEVTVTPAPLAFPLALPSVGVNSILTPSALALALGLPEVTGSTGAVTLTPSPLAFPISQPAVDVLFGSNAYPTPLVLSLGLPSLDVSRSAFTFTPSPLAIPLVLPAVTVQRSAYTFTPSPLVFSVLGPAVTVIRGAVTLTPSPLVFPVLLPDVDAETILQASPFPLVLAVAMPALAVALGPVFVLPDPLALRLFLPRLKRGVGDPTPGRVLLKTLYQVTLTGAADSTTDLLLSAQSVQGTLRRTGNDRVAVYVPNAAASVPHILARLHGTLIVWERLIYSDGTETIGEVIRAPITEPIRRDRGPTKDTLTLSGQLAAELPSGTTRTLANPQQTYIEEGNASFRVPYNVDIRPGDIVSYGGTSFRVGAIQINLGVTSREMQLQETE